MDIYLEKKAQIKRNENILDWSAVALMICSIVSVTAAFVYFGPHSNWLEISLSTIIGLICAFPGVQLIGKLSDFMSRNFVKSYWIEDCGEVIKLHGSVRFTWLDKAYSDLLKVRPGYKVVDDEAYPKYGCTLAAIKATRQELDAKHKLRDLGINIQTIG